MKTRRTKALTIYRKCSCGETAHDYTGEKTTFGNRRIYACRNCGVRRVPAPRKAVAS